MAKIADFKSNIQSKIQQDINEKQKQIASSSAAAKAGSTETPTVTATPKVTQTAKAVPSLKPEITPVSISNINQTPTVNAKDLLGTSSISLRKAATPDMLDGETNTTGISGDINKWLYEVPQKITESFGKKVKESEVGSNAINLFDVSQIDFFRFGINSTQGWMQKYYNSPLVGLPQSVKDGEIGANILNQRNKTIESAFDKLEERDQGLSMIPEYQEAKETADKWAEQGKGIRDAIDEGRWDVVTTRVGETMGQMIPAIVVSAITKNPKAAAGTIFTTIYGDAYKRNLTEVMKNPEFHDLTQNQKNDLTSSLALVEASIETAGDVLELAPFMKGKFSISNMLGLKNVILSFIANLEGSAIIEGGEEVATEILQNIFKRAYGGTDRASLQELGEIFSDTFWIMQLAGLISGGGGAVETHRRNTAVNALSHEAEKYDNFDEFESAAKRGGIEDEELIQEGWAKAKGLTNEQADTLKYDVNYVESLEEESSSLYEEKNDIENSISNLKEKSEEKNRKQISKLEARLQEIDNRIEEISKSIEEYMETYGKQEEELPATDKEQQLPKEVGGENLSKQTMKTVQDSGEATQPTGSELQYKQATGEIETPTQRYIKLIKKLNSKTTKYSESEGKEFKLKEDVIKELKYMSVDAGAELLSQYDSYSFKQILGVADRTLKSMKQGRNTRIKQDQLAKLYEQLTKGLDLKNQMIEELKGLKDKTSKEEVEGISDYRLLTGIGDFESARSAFSRQKTIYGKHLVGLKNVSIKQLEGKITDKAAKRFSLMLAKASQILGIDFNKVIGENDLTLTVGNKDNVDGFFNRDWTKESLTEVLKELKNKGEDTSMYDNLAERTFKACIYLATLDSISVSEATATLVHEFVHMLDYRRVIDLGLKAYIDEHHKISRRGARISSKEADYVLKGDKKWETFNNPEDIDSERQENREKYDKLMAGTIDLAQMTYDDVTYANEMLYIYDPTEIFARYAEQYYLWKNDKEMFDKYSKKTGYWTEEKFKELVDDFEKLLNDEFADYKISEGNRNYHDLMVKLEEYKYNQTLVSDKERLEQIKNGNPQMQQEAAKKMLQMQQQYIEISNELDSLEGIISEEVRAEYATELDDLATNMGILEQTLQDYTDFVDKKVPVEDFESADAALESENIEEDLQQIEDESDTFQEQEDMQNEMEDQIDEAGGIENIDEWKDRESEYQGERKTQKERERHRNLVESRDSIWDVAKDILTPAMSRIYNINKRIAGRLTQMETQTGINIYRYTQRCQGFVNQMNSLEGTAKLEVTEALLNYGALAKEQGDDIAEYKKEESAKLREVLLRNGFKEKDINDMFSVLNDLGNRYKDSGLSISLSDMYFPRVVKDYKGLIEYMSRVSGTQIEDKTKDRLMKSIQEIIDNQSYSDEEKEKLIRNKLTIQFPRKIKVGSKHSEERKMGKLSDWGAGIYAYYEDPTVSLAHYITTMEQAIQRQLFLGGQAKDLGLDVDTINSSNEESVASIVRGLVERGDITESQVNELQKCIIAVMDKKNTPRWIQRVKDITYVMALTNYISAINQAEDIGVAIIENKRGLISVIKSIFSKAGIKYDDSGLESAYEMFKSDLGIANKLFAASGFNFTDRLGKKCFLNAAWTSMVERAKNGKTKKYLHDRLVAMYGEETGEHIMEKVESGSYMTDGQIDIDVLTDLLYQLGTTQPIYSSAMPVAYLRSPNARWFYALSMFSIRQMDHIIQSTKQTYQEKGFTPAAVQAFWFIAMRMFFGALVGDLGDWFQGKGKDETWLGQLLSNGPEDATKKFLEDYLKAFSKLWMLSDYDKDTFKKDGIRGVVSNKMYPYIIQEMHKFRKATERAFKNEDPTELMPMLRDVPLIGKVAYSWWNYYAEESSKKSESGFIRRSDSGFVRRKDDGFVRRKDEGFVRRK